MSRSAPQTQRLDFCRLKEALALPPYDLIALIDEMRAAAPYRREPDSPYLVWIYLRRWHAVAGGHLGRLAFNAAFIDAEYWSPDETLESVVAVAITTVYDNPNISGLAPVLGDVPGIFRAHR